MRRLSQPDSSEVAVQWMDEVLKKSINEIDHNFKKFRISEASDDYIQTVLGRILGMVS